MRSLRWLTVLLVLLVLLPAGALAWLGLGASEASEHALRLRIRQELDQGETEARGRVGAVLRATDAGLARATRGLAGEVASRLPLEGDRAVLRELAGRDLTLLDDGAVGGVPAVRARVGPVRLLDADGRQIHPAVFEPTDALPPADRPAGVVERLRRDADRLRFGRGDAGAALSLWEETAVTARDADLAATAEVEAALLRIAASDAPSREAGAEAARLAHRWGLDRLRALGRPTFRLWLALAQAHDGPGPRPVVSNVLLGLAPWIEDGGLDVVPLTPEERAWLDEQADPRPPDALLRRADLPAGAVLEIEVGGWSRSLALHLDAVAPEGPVRWRASPGPATSSSPSSSPATPGEASFERALDVEGPGGLRVHLLLRHETAAVEVRNLGVRRVLTLGGVLSLLALVVVGLGLVRRALVRERDARRLRDDFLANVTHELRTPLTSVLLHADLLADGDPPPARRQALVQVVKAEGARLSALVEDLLDFAALARGARTLEPEPVDLAAAATRAVAPYATLAEREGTRLDVEVPAGERLALADAHALARVLANLLANAWRHGRPSRDGAPGRLRVTVAAGEPPAVEVADDGKGIRPEDRERIFERFGRGEGAAGVRGVGLGLALSRELARAMGGDLVLVDDARGETVFRLVLPPVPDLEA